MRRIITDKRERSLEMTKLYLKEGMTLRSVGIRFGYDSKTTKKAIEDVAFVDAELYEKAIKKMGILCRETPKKKMTITDLWETLKQTEIKRTDLMGWYWKNGRNQEITSGQLIREARKRGIKVI